LTANWPATLFFFSALFTTPTAQPVENLCAINRHFRVFTLRLPTLTFFYFSLSQNGKILSNQNVSSHSSAVHRDRKRREVDKGAEYRHVWVMSLV